jgi:hypothetical protein
MNQKDPQKYFDQWLTAYSDHLCMVRQGAGVDLAQPTASQPPLTSSAGNSKDVAATGEPKA